MKYLFIIILFFATYLKAQTVTPNVINTTGGGGAVGASGIEVYYNIGEPIIATIGNGTNVITQGFLQPDIVGDFALSITPLSQNESCLNKKDGFASIAINSLPSKTGVVLYKWEPSSVCPNNDCSSLDSLAPGTYSVIVKALDYNNSNIILDSVTTTFTITASIDVCQIHVFNGFTPDGDGLNDNWIIEGINDFPENKVSIFNRWGNKVWSTSGYNNTTNNWNGKGPNGSTLTSGTYFYVIEIDNAVKKGWVELTGK